MQPWEEVWMVISFHPTDGSPIYWQGERTEEEANNTILRYRAAGIPSATSMIAVKYTKS